MDGYHESYMISLKFRHYISAMMELMGRKAQCRCAWNNQYCITGARTHTHTHERCWRQSSGTRRLFNHPTGTHRHDSHTAWFFFIFV